MTDVAGSVEACAFSFALRRVGPSAQDEQNDHNRDQTAIAVSLLTIADIN
jgi:hypothetical protein